MVAKLQSVETERIGIEEGTRVIRGSLLEGKIE